MLCRVGEDEVGGSGDDVLQIGCAEGKLLVKLRLHLPQRIRSLGQPLDLNVPRIYDAIAGSQRVHVIG